MTFKQFYLTESQESIEMMRKMDLKYIPVRGKAYYIDKSGKKYKWNEQSKRMMEFIDNVKIEKDDVDIIKVTNWYKDFNKECFDNKLPDVKIEFMMSKKTGGYASASVFPDGRIEIKKLCISKFYKKDDETIKGILLHEMIHVRLFSKGIAHDIGPDKMHGVYFKRELKEVQEKTKIKIPLTDSEVHDISDNVKNITYDVVLTKQFWPKEVKYSIEVLKKGIILDNYDYFVDDWEGQIDFWKKYREAKLEVYFLQSDNILLRKFPLKYKIKRKQQMYVISNEEAEMILKNGTSLRKLG